MKLPYRFFGTRIEFKSANEQSTIADSFARFGSGGNFEGAQGGDYRSSLSDDFAEEGNQRSMLCDNRNIGLLFLGDLQR